jgi:glycerol-3-phosphate dehydrogenase (NAD(P)+)
MARLAVIGTGAWGTAAAVLAAGSGPVALLGRDPGKAAAMAASRRHDGLGKAVIPPAVAITADPACLADAELILWAVPTQHAAAQAARLATAIPPGAGVVSLAKGLEEGSLRRVSEVLAAALPGRPLACLSGPSHAIEIAGGLPACLVAAGDDALCRRLVEVFHRSRMRVYTCPDLVGVELGGALKNVIAVGSGMCEGLGLGDNARAALITRGLAEIRRLGRCLGAQDATFAGMAGIGDLLTTCYAPHGRNRALGLAVARGEDPVDFLRRAGTVAEGAWTCRAAVELGRRHGAELPIAGQVAAVLWSATPVRDAVNQLLSRAPKEEDA